MSMAVFWSNLSKKLYLGTLARRLYSHSLSWSLVRSVISWFLLVGSFCVVPVIPFYMSKLVSFLLSCSLWYLLEIL